MKNDEKIGFKLKAIISKQNKYFGSKFGRTILKPVFKMFQNVKFLSFVLTEK